MSRVMVSDTAIRYRIGQYDIFRSPEKALYLQKRLMTSKLQNQIDFFMLLNKVELQDARVGLERYKEQIHSQDEKRDLPTIEFRAGHLYFRNYAGFFPAKYKFDSRHGGGLVMLNRYCSRCR
jgi:CRISPR/Cas system-associated endonuclease Cas1